MIFKAILDVKESIYNTLGDVFKLRKPQRDFFIEITITHGSGKYIIAFDPSYISKSGKKTPGLDKFWSGVAGQAKLGLEISGIAAVDIENNTTFHLEAVQTPTYQNILQLMHIFRKSLLSIRYLMMQICIS